MSWVGAAPSSPDGEATAGDDGEAEDAGEENDSGGGVLSLTELSEALDSSGVTAVSGHAAVALYFEELLLLAAACCEGRNYSAIALLQPHYPYELLLSVLYSSGAEKLRAAACVYAATP